jgi:hypothetical protein
LPLANTSQARARLPRRRCGHGLHGVLLRQLTRLVRVHFDEAGLGGMLARRFFRDGRESFARNARRARKASARLTWRENTPGIRPDGPTLLS